MLVKSPIRIHNNHLVNFNCLFKPGGRLFSQHITILGGFFILLLASCSSCTKADDPILITVKAGKHHGNHQIIKLKPIGNTISVDVFVDDTWFWPGINGISKVIGIYWGHVHKNSIRLGWDGDQFCYYAYHNGQSPQENTELKGRMFAAIKGWYHFDIGYSDGYYSIQYQDIIYRVKAPDNLWAPPQISLPYEGGNDTLPYDWTINIKIY